MSDPSTRRVYSIVLIVAGFLLLLAIAIGNGMGNRLIGQVIERGTGGAASSLNTPTPEPSSGPYGPNWKKEQVMAAATDPAFPDPRVPPVPPPAPLPPTPVPKLTPPPAASMPPLNPRTPLPGPRTPVPNPTFTVAPRPTSPASSRPASPQPTSPGTSGPNEGPSPIP